MGTAASCHPGSLLLLLFYPYLGTILQTSPIFGRRQHLSLDFDSYQQKVQATAVYPGSGEGEEYVEVPRKTLAILYTALGAAGECGEIADKVKRILRDDGGILTEDRRLSIAKEAGDAFWYLAALCEEIGFTAAEVALMNLDKLRDRQERGVLHGSGDDR